MTPLSLLTTGRTIRSFRNRASVYSLANMGVAPNFSAGRIKSPTPPHPAPQASQSTLFDKPQRPVAAPAMRPPAVAPVAAWPRTVWTRLMEFCGALAQRWSTRRKRSPFQTTVQPELALEKVKVLRNDLSDDDLELVPIVRKDKPDQHEQCQSISTAQ
jgi:hypothetical protein